MIKNIIFDFDGVILDSIPMKTEAFRTLFQDYDRSRVNTFIDFHLLHGGKSRYIKIRYFFECLLHQEITNNEVEKVATYYSELTRNELSKEKYLIQDTMDFIIENYQNYNMYIASGADEEDLLFICNKLNITKYFKSIHGSPRVKKDIISNIIISNMFLKEETILIGDSINDLDAAEINKIHFVGYNNLRLDEKSLFYLKDFGNKSWTHLIKSME